MLVEAKVAMQRTETNNIKRCPNSFVALLRRRKTKINQCRRQVRLTFETPNVKISTHIVSKLTLNITRQQRKPSISPADRATRSGMMLSQPLAIRR